MNRKILKIIVAVWSIFISLDEVLYFFALEDKSISNFPFVAILLLTVGVLILIPRMEKLDRLLLIVAVVFFGYFSVMGVVRLINIVAGTTLGEVFTSTLFRQVSAQLKSIFFYLIPALLGIMYLGNKQV